MRGALVIALFLTGCGILQPGAPDWVTNREPLPACGGGLVRVDGPEADSARACLLEAFRERDGAELVTIGEMATGDPLVSYVRVHENGTVEMFLNLGDDPSASGAWERFRCEDLVANETLRGADGVFSLEGCEQLPLP